MALSDEQLAEIERRLAAVDEHATEGPWVYLDGTDAVEVHPPGGQTELVVTVWGEAGSNEEGALGEFVSHARSDVRALLAEVDRLRAENERMESAVRGGLTHVGEVLADRDRARKDAKSWHDTYQQHAGAVDQFFAELLELLPGAADVGADAYDQIPRGIEALREGLASARGEIEGLVQTVAAADADRDRLAEAVTRILSALEGGYDADAEEIARHALATLDGGEPDAG